MKSAINALGLGALALCVLLCGMQTAALAFVPADQNAAYEILLPRVDLFHHDSFAALQGSRLAEQALAGELGGAWRVHGWNPQTDRPRWIYGSGRALAAGVGDAVQLEDLARELIAAQPAVFGADVADLRLSDAPHALNKWAAHFQQTWHGLDVWQGGVTVVLSDAGSLVIAGGNYYRDIDLDPTPRLSAAQATAAATGALPFDPATDSVEGGAVLLVLPVAVSETGTEYHLVWRVRVRTEEPLGIWVTHVDAHTGDIVWRTNDISFAYLGDSESDVEPITYCDGVVQQAMPHLQVEVDGVGTVITDADGNWSIAGSGFPRAVDARFYGPYCNIYDVVGGAEGGFSGVANADVPLTVRFWDTNSRQDERDVFDAVNDIHDFFQLFAPEFAYTNARIQARVNIGECCNAYYDGRLNFFMECGGCANTGEIQGVVHHEYGHGITANIIGNQGNEGIGEGNSDIIANLITRESIIGRGFNLGNCNSGIRNSNNNLIYPDDLTGQIHTDGQIIAGFHWDAMEQLWQYYGEDQGTVETARTWHYGRILMHPYWQQDQVTATFIADDDDDNLANGTPHYPVYYNAATHHGYDVPEITEGVLVTHTPLDDTMDTENAYGVSASIVSTEGPLDSNSARIFWRLAGDAVWNEVVLTPTGMGDNFAGHIPAQDYGVVQYYLRAEDTVGTVGTAPIGAPNSYYDFQIAWQVDPMESAGAWQAGIPGDNATAGIWVWADPNPSGYQPGDDHTNYGTHCWITGQHTPGQPDNADDVDGGTTTLLSPVIDLSGASEVTVSYWRWFTTSTLDVWRAYASNDGGVNWTFLETVSGSTSGWNQRSYDLTAIFPDPAQVRLKFTVQDSGPDSIVEGALDDLLIAAVFGTTDAGDGLAVSFVGNLAQNVPNPFNPATEIRFSLPTAGEASLRVFDAQGRLVRELASGARAAGEHSVIWHGDDAGGQPVPTGVYFYRLETQDGHTASRRMVLIK